MSLRPLSPLPAISAVLAFSGAGAGVWVGTEPSDDIWDVAVQPGTPNVVLAGMWLWEVVAKDAPSPGACPTPPGLGQNLRERECLPRKAQPSRGARCSQ
jgi:hypothetical protein